MLDQRGGLLGHWLDLQKLKMALDLSPQKAWLVLNQPPGVEPQVRELPVRDKELTHTCPQFLIPPESGPAEVTAKTLVRPGSRPERWVASSPLDDTTPPEGFHRRSLHISVSSQYSVILPTGKLLKRTPPGQNKTSSSKIA